MSFLFDGIYIVEINSHFVALVCNKRIYRERISCNFKFLLINTFNFGGKYVKCFLARC